MRNKILKSFETFVSQPLSLLCGKIIRVTNLQTDFSTNKSINVGVSKESIQVNVVNSENAYNLLSAVVYKKKMNELKAQVGVKFLRTGFQTVGTQHYDGDVGWRGYGVETPTGAKERKP